MKKRIVTFGLYVFGVFFAGVVLAQAVIIIPEYQQIVSVARVREIPKDIVVFGGGMKSATEQSDMQEDRVRTGAALWQRFPSSTLWFTGDDGAWRGNEIAAMTAFALTLGVPSTSMRTDPHGYRTIRSCNRLVSVYGVKDAIVISQQFHVYRILFLCHNAGMQAVGISADMRPYVRGWVTAWPREWGARVKAVGEVLWQYIDR
jgi:vancomycin permeability regulator SanA